MLKMTNTYINEESRVFNLPGDIKIHCKTLYNENIAGKTAIYIHGGGSGGNHTIVARPSYWMLDKGLFEKIILPDRRGAGLSSPITKIMTYEDNVRDMKNLLDSMGIDGKITAMGISYGGPIALTLAAIDPRVEEVVLVASSPSLKPAKGIMGFLYKHNLLERIVRSVYKRYVGKLPEACTDFDRIYDAKNVSQLKQLFLDGIKHTPKERFESLMLENASTCSLENQGISGEVRVNVPVYRVIGTKDEVWEVDTGDLYKDRIPFMKTAYVEGANHKDVFFKTDEFYQALYYLLNENKR